VIELEPDTVRCGEARSSGRSGYLEINNIFLDGTVNPKRINPEAGVAGWAPSLIRSAYLINHLWNLPQLCRRKEELEMRWKKEPTLEYNVRTAVVPFVVAPKHIQGHSPARANEWIGPKSTTVWLLQAVIQGLQASSFNVHASSEQIPRQETSFP